MTRSEPVSAASVARSIACPAYSLSLSSVLKSAASKMGRISLIFARFSPALGLITRDAFLRFINTLLMFCIFVKNVLRIFAVFYYTKECQVEFQCAQLDIRE